MPPSSGDSNVQRIQTDHRLKLAEFWDIKNGSKVLEIGCGQGDTTAVLAFLVGEKGFVQGVDIASPDYGSPLTIGESISYLKKSPIGNRIKIDFNMDILSPTIEFPENHFDLIVLSHSSWYLKSAEELHAILNKLRKWGTLYVLLNGIREFNLLNNTLTCYQYLYKHNMSVLKQLAFRMFVLCSLLTILKILLKVRDGLS